MLTAPRQLPRPHDFGFSVAISGRTVVVGAPDTNDGRGVVFVFVRSGKAWSQQARLTATDAAPMAGFGWSVGISGTDLMVGAFRHDDGRGAAYVFARTGKAWSQQALLTASDAAVNDEFGTSVAISGKTAVIGAPHRAPLQTGAAYVFARTGRTWSQQEKLTASRFVPFGSFGVSVAISGKTALVGQEGGSGAAYVFVRSGRVWPQQALLTASDASAGDLFGHSVAIDGKTALIGTYGRSDTTGAAYVFVRTGRAWSQRAELTASDAAPFSGFGFAVAISGKTAVVGADTHAGRTGAAYVFVRSGGP